MKKNPKVSILIPAYNSEKTIRICVESVFNQNYPEQLREIIVINDGSTDKTLQILESIQSLNSFQILSLKNNQGLATARNKGIEKSTGEILIFLDSDMEVEPDFVKKHVEKHNCPGVYGVVSCIKAASDIIYDKYQRYIYEGNRGARKFPANNPLPFHVFIFGLTSIKREVIENIGLMNSDIKIYGGEDTEFAYRIWVKYPTGLFYGEDIFVYHHHYRKLSRVLILIEKFGNQVVPMLIKKYPELAKIYGIDFINHSIPNVELKSNFFKVLAGKIIKKVWFQAFVYQLFKITPFPFSNFLVRILMASALIRGIESSLE